jgi:hypothetical protein
MKMKNRTVLITRQQASSASMPHGINSASKRRFPNHTYQRSHDILGQPAFGAERLGSYAHLPVIISTCEYAPPRQRRGTDRRPHRCRRAGSQDEMSAPPVPQRSLTWVFLVAHTTTTPNSLLPRSRRITATA